MSQRPVDQIGEHGFDEIACRRWVTVLRVGGPVPGSESVEGRVISARARNGASG